MNTSSAHMQSEMARLDAAAGFLRAIVIGLTAFLTVVDLFAAQAILPSLVTHYGVTPAAMGLAVNACTFGMAVAGFGVALLSRRIDRRTGILVSLGLLAIPTTLLAFAPNIWVFAGLRVLQGLAMSTAFRLTLAYMGERFSASEAAGAFAAYITGNVASNLVGRFIAAAVVDHAGLAANFYLFAALEPARCRPRLFHGRARAADDGQRRRCGARWRPGRRISRIQCSPPASASASASCSHSSARSPTSTSC